VKAYAGPPRCRSFFVRLPIASVPPSDKFCMLDAVIGVLKLPFARQWPSWGFVMIASVCTFAILPPAARAAGSGTLVVTTSGLPTSQPAAVLVQGPGLQHVLLTGPSTLGGLRPGIYRLEIRRVTVTHAGIPNGASAYPARKRIDVRIRPGRTTRISAAYAGVVNPEVRSLPRVLGVAGSANDPSAVDILDRHRAPRVGTIYTAGPGRMLPFGLVSRVTGVSRVGKNLRVALVSVPITDATPQLAFSGSLQLLPATSNASGASAHAAASCRPPSLVNINARLESVELRRAFVGTWPPQLELTLAIRTNETLGVAAAAVGVNCDWTLHEIGPFDRAVAVGPIVVPVYATLPLTASIHVNGTLNVGTFNIASTTVANVAGGFDFNEASLSEQGTNVWVSGTPSISGSAKLSAAIGVQAGIGIAKGANAHAELAFGPELNWSSGHQCVLQLNMGSLSAGVTVLGHSLNSPPYTPWQLHLWSGCNPATPPPTPPPSQPSGGTTPPTSPSKPSSPEPEQPSTGPVTEPQQPPTNEPEAPHSDEGFFVEDDIYGGTWARTDPNNGQWYPHSTPPPNGAYWYPNGLGVAVSCAESAAPYEAVLYGQHQTWTWWAHVTDGKWVPTVVFSTVWSDGLPAGLSEC
jgi:hypothetical protein